MAFIRYSPFCCLLLEYRCRKGRICDRNFKKAFLFSANQEFKIVKSRKRGLGPLSEGAADCRKAQNIDVIANQPAGWCGDPFSLSLVERHVPKGSSVCRRHTQGSALQGIRIATPVCALARNDMVFRHAALGRALPSPMLCEINNTRMFRWVSGSDGRLSDPGCRRRSALPVLPPSGTVQS